MIDFNDGEFKQIIYDHKSIIIKYSTLYKITNTMRSVYQYRDTMFVIKELNIPSDMIWLIKYINNIDQLSTLLEKSQLYIPNIDFLQTLYDKYLTYKAKKIN